MNGDNRVVLAVPLDMTTYGIPASVTSGAIALTLGVH